MAYVRKEWASADAIRTEVADVPEPWLRGFAIKHPRDCRKFAAARNGAMLYRVEAVLVAIENGESMPNEGIVAAREMVGGLTTEQRDLAASEIGAVMRGKAVL